MPVGDGSQPLTFRVRNSILFLLQNSRHNIKQDAGFNSLITKKACVRIARRRLPTELPVGASRRRVAAHISRTW